MQAKRAKNKEPVIATALLTKLLQAVTNGVPAGLDCMRVKMTALVHPDLALLPAGGDPADGADTLDLSQLRESRIIPAGQRWSVNLDLYGQVQRSATEQVQWLAHEIYKADLVIKDGRAFGVCVAGTFSIDSVTISAHSDANKIMVRNVKMPASVLVQFTTLPPDEMLAVLGLIQKILAARMLRRGELQEPHMNRDATESAPMERTLGLVGANPPAGRLAPLFRRKGRWSDISHTNENGKDCKIEIKFSDQIMRALTGQNFGHHKQPARMSMRGSGEAGIDDVAGLMLEKIEQMDFQTVKQARYMFGEAFKNGGLLWVTTADIATALGIERGGKQWREIEKRQHQLQTVQFDCVILGKDRKPADGVLTTPLLAFMERRADKGELWVIPPTLLSHVQAGYGARMDSRALLLGTKTLHEKIATRMYWSAARYLSLNRRRGVTEWTRKVSECMGDQLGITARSVKQLRSKQKAGRDALLDVLRKACTLLEVFKHDGQTIHLVHSARIAGDTIDNATVHVVLLPDTKQVGITNPPALPAGVA